MITVYECNVFGQPRLMWADLETPEPDPMPECEEETP